MKMKSGLLLSIVGILISYSSEISFMPNFVNRPDNWHLFGPLFIFFGILLSLIIIIVIQSIREKEVQWDNLIMVLVSIALFGMLNNPKSSILPVWYIGLVINGIILIILLRTGNTSKELEKETEN